MDFTPIVKYQKLEKINFGKTYISDISFLEKNKNIKELDLYDCTNIKDFIPIAKFQKLEKLNIGKTYISGLSFLVKNNNIKELNLN